MSSKSGSVLLKIGGLGYFLGFASWAVWAIMAVLSFEGLLTYNINNYTFQVMSGIFFQASYSRLIFYSLLSLSLLLSAVGCFALWQKLKSELGIASGVVFLLAFASSVVYLGYVRGSQFLLLFFLGLILWGATLLTLAGKTTSVGRSRAAGAIFIVSGAFGMLILPAILYWGIEMWLLLLGWLYAAGALLSASIFFRISRNTDKPPA
jgi:hypothetical protein